MNHAILRSFDDHYGTTFPVVIAHGEKFNNHIRSKCTLIADITHALSLHSLRHTGYHLQVGGGVSFAGVFIAVTAEGTSFLLFITCKWCWLFYVFGAHALNALLANPNAANLRLMNEFQPIVAYWYFVNLVHNGATEAAFMRELEAMKDFSSLGKSIAVEMSRAGGIAARDQGMHSHSFDLTHVLGVGIHGATQEQRLEWSVKGGIAARDKGMHSHSFDLTHVLGKGLFDEANREVVLAGNAKGGAAARDEGMHSHSFDLTHVLGKG